MHDEERSEHDLAPMLATPRNEKGDFAQVCTLIARRPKTRKQMVTSDHIYIYNE